MKNKKGWIFVLVLLIIIVLVGFLFFSINSGEDILGFSEKSSNYQAVFLVNNQVYFGKLTKINSQYPVLKDIYYLQVNQSIQPIEEGQSSSPDISLIKLGGELHGPTDEMKINREHILLIENLRSDSNLVSAILKHKKNIDQAVVQPEA